METELATIDAALKLIDLSISNEALSTAHRLKPEATGLDIIRDVEYFRTWLHTELPSILGSWHSHPDLSNIACCGESVGGYLLV